VNEAEELARLVGEIRETVKIMLAVQTPELPRELVEGPHIGKVINTFNEYFKEHGSCTFCSLLAETTFSSPLKRTSERRKLG
jgi:hypothetical protein